MNSSILYRFSFNSCNKIKIATFIFPREYFNSSGGRPCMKRILLLGIILAILILAMPQGVLALSDAKTAIVNANVVQALTFSVTPAGALTDWQLTSGTTNDQADAVTFHVISTAGWDVKAADATTSGHPGHLVQWDGSTYPASAKFIAAAMKIGQLPAAGMADLSASASPTLATHGAGTWDTDTTDLSQAVNLVGDERLQTNNYRIVITFTCAQPF